MERSILERFGLGVPASLAMPAAGIDISRGSVKFTEFLRAHGSLSLRTYGETPLQEGVVVDGDVEKPDVVVEVLRSFRLKHHIKYAHASLSEKKAYLYQILVPQGTASLKEGVEFDLEAHVPLPPAETVFDFEPVKTTVDGTVVAVSAYARRVVESYEKIFKSAGIVLRSLEVESHALARAAVTPDDRSRVVMIVDFGKVGTRVAVVDHGVVSYTATMDLGGDMLTQALMKRFSIDAPAAEEMKNARGFLLGKDNADVVEAVMISISIFKDELSRHLTYWNTPDEDDLPRTPVERIIIAGGNANMMGFAEYLGDALGIAVVPANVWGNAFSLDRYVPPMHFNESLEYATAIGLALRSAQQSPW